MAAWVLVALIAGTVLTPERVAADQTPAGCSQNNLVLNIGRDKTVVRNGDTINYTVSLSNLDTAQGPACNITGAIVTFVAPAADGTPTGAQTVLRAGVDVPAGTTPTVLGTVPYLVAVNPGVSDTVAEAVAVGVLHDAPTNDKADVVKTLGSTVTQPHTTLSASVSLGAGGSPLKVQSHVAHYTYLEHNDSTTPSSMTGVVVADNACAPVTYAGGDGNANHLLDPGETWTYTCSRALSKPGTYVDTAAAAGIDTSDGRAAPPEETTVSTTVATLGAALPVTGPPVPLEPLGLLAGLLIGLGVLSSWRGRAGERSR